MGRTEWEKEGIVHIENLVKRYGSLVALDHLNLDIMEGEIFGLLGPNGSGKTTAISCMLALLKYDKGSIRIMGEEMSPDSYEVKSQIGIVLQNVAVFEELTVYENIDYFCGLYVKERKRKKQLVEEALVFTGLEDYRKMRPKKLSGGLLRRLNIACGIAHKPNSGGDQRTESSGFYNYIYFSLHGRSRAALQQDRHNGSWKMHCSGKQGTAYRNDQNRRKGDH